MEGDPKFETSQNIPNVPYHKFAELIGLKGIYCDDPAQVGAAWEAALASERPCVIEFKTDPEVPPLPAHISLLQAQKYASALIKGDPNQAGILGQTVRQALAGFTSRR